MVKYIKQLNERIMLIDKANYYRAQYQSFMTGPEWRNVEMAEEYAQFIRENNSIFQFPYFRQIAQLWKVIFRSYRAARQYDSAWNILTSEYIFMDLFVGFFTTMEMLPKALLSLFLSPLFKSSNPSEMQAYIANYYEQYARDLHTVPFYDHDYQSIKDRLAEQYAQLDQKTWGDRITWRIVSFELFARKWISKPLSYWFHQDENLVPATTDVLVKCKFKGMLDEDTAIKKFKRKLTKIAANSHDELPAVSIVNDNIYTQQRRTKGNTAVYARLRVPRYDAFMPALQTLAEKKIYLRRIASQDRVQIKCKVNADSSDQLETMTEDLKETKKAHHLYSYVDSLHKGQRFMLFDVPTRNLHKTVERLNKKTDVDVTFIHNF